MDQGYSFTVVNNEGLEVTCDVISMIADKDSRIYLLYTDYLLDEKGNFRLLASELIQQKEDFVLKDIIDQKKVNELIKSAKSIANKAMANA